MSRARRRLLTTRRGRDSSRDRRGARGARCVGLRTGLVLLRVATARRRSWMTRMKHLRAWVEPETWLLLRGRSRTSRTSRSTRAQRRLC